tara:strand:+ start:3158 stop:3319 length:162 start_codon:yes stop_codon:yes gene_type:complete
MKSLLNNHKKEEEKEEYYGELCDKLFKNNEKIKNIKEENKDIIDKLSNLMKQM